MNELKIIEKQMPSIKTNAEELKLHVTDLLKKYEGIIATDDSYKDLKKDRAYLNKISKEIDDSRKKVKKELSKPITEFEDEMKSIVSIVKETSNDLNTQISQFEQSIKNEKLKDLKQYVLERIEEKGYPKEYADKIEINPSYYNISASFNGGKFSIDTQLHNFHEFDLEKIKGVETIKTMCETMSSNLDSPLEVERYIKCFDGTNLNALVQVITSGSQRQMKVEKETKERLQRKIEQEKLEKEKLERESIEKQKEQEQQRELPKVEEILFFEVEEEIETPFNNSFFDDEEEIRSVTWTLTGSESDLSKIRKFVITQLDVEIEEW